MSPARTAAGVVARNVGGETVLVPTRADVARFDRIFVLSRVGAFLWPLIDGTRDRDELCRLVQERYEVPASADVARDV
ncbi:MAG TPA: PqqD family protein, partial [Polyangia bacterium]